MHRFYVPLQNISHDKIIISDKEKAHHIRDVLRLRLKEGIVVFDDRGNEYNCVIEGLSAQVTLKIISKQSIGKIKKFRIAIACAIPKRAKMEDIIDKLTQLGVDRIIPLKTERVVVKLDRPKESLRGERWRKVAESASQQSQRYNMPFVDKIQDIRDLLSNSGGFDLKLIPTLTGKRKSLKEIFSSPGYRNILVLIGPEGDFSDEEIELAKAKGFIPVTLGDLVLRVETAAVAVASFIRLYEPR